MKVVPCSSCGARMVFVKTLAGGNMPCDADTVAEDDYLFKPGKHMPHWATCPNAAEHRKREQERRRARR